ncbi:MAG: hypothetical protein AB3N33_06725 [Puniceicoccaceae bacterium]
MSLEKDKQFEKQLRESRPVVPSPALRDRIGEAIAAKERKQNLARWRIISGWGGLAVAAAALITFGILLFNGRLEVAMQSQQSQEEVSPPLTVSNMPQENPDAFKPVLAENNLKGRIDEGIVFLDNGLTARRYRYEFVDRVVWRNPADGAVVEMEIPRDEVVLIPVQTF